MSSCLWFVHNGDEPSVDVDDDVALPDTALVRIRLLLNFAKHKVKTKLVTETQKFNSLLQVTVVFLHFSAMKVHFQFFKDSYIPFGFIHVWFSHPFSY